MPRGGRENRELFPDHEEEKRAEKQVDAQLQRKRRERLRAAAFPRFFVAVEEGNGGGGGVGDGFHGQKNRGLSVTAGGERKNVLENAAVVEGGHEGVSGAGGFVGLRAGDEERVDEIVGVGERRFGGVEAAEAASRALLQARVEKRGKVETEKRGLGRGRREGGLRRCG